MRICPAPGCPNGQPCAEHARKPFASAERTSNLYGTERWKRERKKFLAQNPRCICGCGHTASVVDHEPPHRGDGAAFWDRSTWRAMTRSCHNAKTGRETRERVNA